MGGVRPASFHGLGLASDQACLFRPVRREQDRSQIPWIPIRAPLKRASLPVCLFFKGLKKDNPAPDPKHGLSSSILVRPGPRSWAS